jgi:hypothetical protein
MRKRAVFLRALGLVLFAIAVFCTWYGIATNYDYRFLAGTYIFQGENETCTLYLRADHTFLQILSRAGAWQRAEGQWYRYGESHVSFSNEFLKVAGEETNASGQAHGEFEKRLGIFPILLMAPLPNGPTFHKKPFR